GAGSVGGPRTGSSPAASAGATSARRATWESAGPSSTSTAARGRGARRPSAAGRARGASTRASPSTTSSPGCGSSGARRAAAHDREGRPQDPRPARPERPEGRASGRALRARRGLGGQPRLHLSVRSPPERLRMRRVRGAREPHAGDGVAARDRADGRRAPGDVGRRAREPLPLSGAARTVSLRGLHRRPLMEERAKRRILVGIMLSVFLAAMESTVVATAMPTVVRSLGGIQIYSWVFSGFLLTQTVTMPLWGRFSDLYGRRPVLAVAGVALFTAGVSALLLGIGQAGRAGSWSGAAVLSPLALGLTGLVLCVVVERRAAEPIVPLRLFGSRMVIAAVVTRFLA